MTTKETGGADCSPAPQGMTYQRQADSSPVAWAAQRTPRKWQRVLAAFLTGRSFNRFQAERPVEDGGLSDHCLHSTVSEIQEKGVVISRKFEKVPGYQNIPTEVKRYWLDLSNVEAVDIAKGLVSEPTSKATTKAADRKAQAEADERIQKAIEQERRFRRVPA